jgi:4-hydroxy-3-methylbut-2-enyl diphosphate reductase
MTKQAVLARPRGFCAGVIRAIEIVELALKVYGAPVYVLHEIVHNQKVLRDLEADGAVFVRSLDAIPSGALTIFSAHGVAAQVIDEAHRKGLRTIDATCPLVTKVHLEVAAHARAGREVILIGHAGHPEVSGTMGRYASSLGGAIHLVGTIEEAWALQIDLRRGVALVTQTTLSVDDTRRIVNVLRDRFPSLLEPRRDDICYATQNRQNAVRALAGQVDVLLVVGARNSSNSNRLREVGEQLGVQAYLVQDAAELDPVWLQSARRVGVTAGASTPEELVRELLSRLSKLGVDTVFELDGERETVSFGLPAALTRAARASVL